jgi:hypothetical protein
VTTIGQFNLHLIYRLKNLIGCLLDTNRRIALW